MAESMAETTRSPNGLILKATLLLTSTLTVMAAATIAPALPAMQEVFAAVDPEGFWVRLVLTIPALFIVISAPIAGIIVDRYGRKPLLIASAVLYGLAGASGAIAPSLVTLLIGRALLGVAVAGLMTSVTTLIADYFTGQARAQFLGFQTAFMGFGGTLFLTLGGVLATIDWRAPFLIYLGAWLLLPFIVGVLYEPRNDTPTPPLPQTLSTPGDCAAVQQTIQSERSERSEPEPTCAPVRLMVFVYGIMVLINLAFYLIPVQLPFFLRDLTNATAAQSGVAIAGLAFCFATASALNGWFSLRFSRPMMLNTGFALAAVGYSLMALADGWLPIMAGLPIIGSGFGLIHPTLNVWLANETPVALRGRVLSGFTTAVFLGQFLSPIVAQPFISAVGFAGMFGFAAGVFLMLSLAGLIVRWQTMQRQ